MFTIHIKVSKEMENNPSIIPLLWINMYKPSIYIYIGLYRWLMVVDYCCTNIHIQIYHNISPVAPGGPSPTCPKHLLPASAGPRPTMFFFFDLFPRLSLAKMEKNHSRFSFCFLEHHLLVYRWRCP